MEERFWQQRWEADQIGFHQTEYNHHLVQHWPTLGLPAGTRVLVPLCGKSLDLLWLRDQGHDVVGVEWSEKAVRAFFAENGLDAERVDVGDACAWRCERLTLYCGDFFALGAEQVGALDAVFDRAALIALPPDLRARYAARISELAPSGARMLLVTLEYEPGLLPGPPFSVDEADVRSRYEPAWDVEVARAGASDGPRGVPVTERVYRGTRR